MSLVKCPECNGEISDSAKFCPICGCSFSVEELKTWEYKIVPFAQKLRKNIDDEKFLAEWEECLDEEGKEGWELIKVIPVSYFQTTGAIFGGATIITLQRFLLVFKREITEEDGEEEGEEKEEKQGKNFWEKIWIGMNKMR